MLRSEPGMTGPITSLEEEKEAELRSNLSRILKIFKTLFSVVLLLLFFKSEFSHACFETKCFLLSTEYKVPTRKLYWSSLFFQVINHQPVNHPASLFCQRINSPACFCGGWKLQVSSSRRSEKQRNSKNSRRGFLFVLFSQKRSIT